MYLEPFRIADRLVTAGEWLEFIADGGYRRPELWLSDGWYAVQEHGWDAPLYWRDDGDDGWSVFTLDGRRPVDPNEPVVHVSHYEADAFARWARRAAADRVRVGARGRVAALARPASRARPTRADRARLHPAPRTGRRRARARRSATCGSGRRARTSRTRVSRPRRRGR